MDTHKPTEGQIWVLHHNKDRIIKILVCDDEAGLVLGYEDVGPHKSLNRRPISYLTLRECWAIAGSKAAKKKVDESNLCAMVRGAVYRMRYPSDAERGRLVRLMQWDDEVIPGGGKGYEDHGADMKMQKDLSVYQFRRKWEMVCYRVDEIADYLIADRPLVRNEHLSRGRPPAGHTHQERDVVAVLRKKLEATQEDLDATKKVVVELVRRVQQLEVAAAGNVIPMAGRSKKAK
jgi:hypothetical protein